MSRLHQIHVRAIPQRRNTHGSLRAAIEASDLGGVPVEWHEQPGTTYDAAWWAGVLRSRASNSRPDDLLLFLEDDVALINRHVRHNIESWSALDEADFGLGWLCLPNGALDDERLVGRTAVGNLFRNSEKMNNSAGVLVRRSWLAALIEAADLQDLRSEYMHWPYEGHVIACTDTGWSQLTWKLGRRVYLHKPGLVAADDLAHSYIQGGVTPDWERGCSEGFDGRWRRCTPTDQEAFIAGLLRQIGQAPSGPEEPLDMALADLPADAVALEFGVYMGGSLNRIAAKLSQGTVVGFDSLRGLPTDWRPGFPAGSYDTRGELPEITPPAKLMVGDFSETLLAWLEGNQAVPSLVHIDCDVYESTDTALTLLGDRIDPDTVLVFDELVGYKGFEDHEVKALYEYVAARDLDVVVLRSGGRWGQAVSMKLGRS